MSPTTGPKMRLITNLSYAHVSRGGNPVRTNVSALLLQDRGSAFSDGPRNQVVCGFGPDFAWPVFDVWLDCPVLDYEVEGFESRHQIIEHDGDARPLMQGSVLTWKDGTKIALMSLDGSRPVDVVDASVHELDELVVAKAATYWVGPNMPVLKWVPANDVRRAVQKHRRLRG